MKHYIKYDIKEPLDLASEITDNLKHSSTEVYGADFVLGVFKHLFLESFDYLLSKGVATSDLFEDMHYVMEDLEHEAKSRESNDA